MPHADNISYFGNGHDEAQMVYQFPLAPLVLHTLLTGDASDLAAGPRRWRRPGGHTFFNFEASHDGIGVGPAEGLSTPTNRPARGGHGRRPRRGHAPRAARRREAVYELNSTCTR